MLKIDEICLRSIRNTDSEFLYKAINDPELIRYSAPFKPVHELEHLKWLGNILADETKRFFIIESNSVPVGYTQLIDIHPIHRSAEITIRFFEEKYCGKGIGTKALTVLCEHSFKDLGLMRVWLRVFESNVRAIRAYEKAGFKEEGIMRKAVYINGQQIDVILMSRLRDDTV